MSKTGKAKSASPETTNATTNSASPAAGPAGMTVSFIKRHPVLTVAGAIVAGVAVSALVPRKAGRRFLGKALHLAEATGAAGALAGLGNGKKAHAIKHVAATLGNRTEEAGQATARQLEKFGLAALAAAGALGKATSDRAGKMGDAVQESSSKVWTIANDLTARLRH